MEGVLAKSPAIAVAELKFSSSETTRINCLARRVRFDAVNRRCKKTSRLALKALAAGEFAVKETASKPQEGPEHIPPMVPLFVGLPLDTVSSGNTVNHGKAIAVGLQALKLLGVHGVELPIFWSVVQPNDPAEFEWSGYIAIAEMVRTVGLHLRISLFLNSSQKPEFPLPSWVSRSFNNDRDLLFTDKSGQRHYDCLSFAVDELPVLDGKTPLEAFKNLFCDFRRAFADYFGNTITDVTVGLGPSGELRYPSFPPGTGNNGFKGLGQFQCYDKYMLAELKRHAELSGNPLWGLSGPHDVPDYAGSLASGGFFREQGGSWESPYGDFFLSWYSQGLVNHADHVLTVASESFSGLPVELSAKVPLLHWWHKTRSRPAQLTAGFYNTDCQDGYEAVAELFKKHSCTMIIPGMDLLDCEQAEELQCSPEMLLDQIRRACSKHGVKVAGENSCVVRPGSGGFGRITENVCSKDSDLKSFTYKRMGVEFFSPDHWPMFTGFVRSMTMPEMELDDLPCHEEGGPSQSIRSSASADREMQAV